MTPLLLAFASAVLQASPAGPPGWTAFTRRFDDHASRHHLVGASVSLVRDGATVARHHFGYADRATHRPVDDGTIFHWASVTKTLTAIAILQLRDRGRLSLDDRITAWVPELRRVHDPYGLIDSVSIRMLLTHTGGFQSPTWPWGRGEPWEPFEPTTWEQLVVMMPYQRLVFRPGSRYGYSNPAYLYLARIVEQISGDPWAVYIQKNIWSPLRLDRSYVGLTPYHLAAERSHGYLIRAPGDTLIDVGADFDPGVTIPNSGWNAPIDDLARFLGFLAGGPVASGPGRPEGVLARRTLEEMWRPEAQTGAALPEYAAVGLGFFVMEVEGRRIVGHTGDQAGYRSYVYLDPATGAGLIMVFNTSGDSGREDADRGRLASEGIRLLH